MEEKNPPAEPKFKTGPFRSFMGLFGVRFPYEKGRWILLTRRFRLLLLTTLLLLVSVFLWFSLYYSNQPQFCASCHLIKPYVESWQTSKHNNVPCWKCHFAPGLAGLIHAKLNGTVELLKTITKTNEPTPRAEVEDAACLQAGCHETRLLQGRVVFKKKYFFDHVPHLTELRRGKKLRCTSCHSQIVQGSHITVTEGVCFMCHFKGEMHAGVVEPIAGCTTCHAAPAKPVTTSFGKTFQHQPLLDRKVPCWKCHSDSVQGTGEVSKQVCLTCHNEPKKMEKYSDSAFVHDWHVTKRKVECFQCHGEIRHGMRPEPLASPSSCEVCHSDHLSHRKMFTGMGGEGIKDRPSTHYEMNLDCVACHETAAVKHDVANADVKTLRVTEAACVGCHGDKIKGTLAEWQGVMDGLLGESKQKLGEAQKAFDALGEGDPRRAAAKAPLDRARHNYEFVLSAFGAHNPDYATDLLYKVQDDADEALRLAREARE